MQIFTSAILIICLIAVIVLSYNGDGLLLSDGYNYSIIKTFLVIVTINLALFAYCLTPISTWDLSRIHVLIDNMSVYGYHYAITQSEYKDLLVINNFYYLISLLHNHDLVQLLVILIDYGLISFVFLELIKKGDITDLSSFFFSFVIFLCFYDLTMAISGIRNVLALTICAVALLNELYFKKINFLMSLPLYIVAYLIHPTSIFVLAARILMIFTQKSKIVYFFILLLPTMMDTVSSFLSKSSISQISYLATKTYYSSKQFGDDIRYLIVKVGFAAFIIYIYFFGNNPDANNDKKTDNSFKNYREFLLSYTVMMLGGLSNVIFFQRMAYIYGILSVPLVVRHVRTKEIMYYVIMGGCLLVISLMVYRFYNVITRGY